MQLHMTQVLCAEPTKKKKRIDPQVIKAREDRRRRKLEKQIRKMEKNARQLKPIDENELPDSLIDAKERKYESISAIISMEKNLIHENVHFSEIVCDRLFSIQRKSMNVVQCYIRNGLDTRTVRESN